MWQQITYQNKISPFGLGMTLNMTFWGEGEGGLVVAGCGTCIASVDCVIQMVPRGWGHGRGGLSYNNVVV